MGAATPPLPRRGVPFGCCATFIEKSAHPEFLEIRRSEVTRRELLRPAFEALSEHRYLIDGLCVVTDALGCSKFLSVGSKGAPCLRVERLLIGTGKRNACDVARHWNGAKVLSLRGKDLDAGGPCRYVNMAGGIDRHPIAISMFQLGEVSAVFDGPV